MQRKFITNLALVIFLNILVKPFWIFGIDRTVQNIVGAGEYGLYFSLFNFSLLMNILLDAGITNFNNRSIARDPGKLREFFSNIVALKLTLALLYAGVCIGMALILGYNKQQFHLLLFLILNQFLASFLLYLRSNISGLHYFRTDSLISVLDRSIVIVICSVLLWAGVTDLPFSIDWFVYAQTAGYSVTVLVAFGIVLRHAGHFRMGIKLPYFGRVLRESYPFALLILLMSFYNRIDSVMLERLLPDGKVQAGIYAQSFRILDAAAMFALLFAGILLPMFSRMLKQGDDPGGMLRLSYSLIMIPALTLAGIALYYPDPVIDWMYREHVSDASGIFTLLMFGFTAISTTYIFGTLLTANRNLKELNLLALSAVAMNIILNLILIPRRQAYGAAIASLVTQAYMAAFQVVISRLRLKLRMGAGYLFRLVLFILVLFASGWLLQRYIEYWYAGILMLAGVAVILAFVTRLLKFRDLYLLIRYGEE